MPPSRFTFHQALHVVLAFGWSDFRLKYRGSFLGFLWSFMFPLFKFLVILHIFRRFDPSVPQYPLYLFLGVLLWEHFSLTTSSCMKLPREKSAVFQKVLFPRILLVLSVGWLHVLILCSYLLIFFLVMLSFGVRPSWNLLYVPLLLLQASFLALGAGMFLGAYVLRYRDIPHIWSIVLQVMFWLTPIMYVHQPRHTLGEDVALLLAGRLDTSSLWAVFDLFIRFQPLSILLYDARRAVIYPDTLGIPSAVHALSFTAAAFAVFAAAAIVFHRRSRYFLQEY